MSTYPSGYQPYPTADDVNAWLLAAQEQQAHLHLQSALTPWYSDQRQEAFTQMSALLCEAVEEVRVMSEATREESQNARSTAVDLRACSTQLMERSAALLDRMAQFAPPPPEAIREAERQFLATFRDGTKPESP